MEKTIVKRQVSVGAGLRRSGGGTPQAMQGAPGSVRRPRETWTKVCVVVSREGSGEHPNRLRTERMDYFGGLWPTVVVVPACPVPGHCLLEGPCWMDEGLRGGLQIAWCRTKGNSQASLLPSPRTGWLGGSRGGRNLAVQPVRPQRPQHEDTEDSVVSTGVRLTATCPLQ